MADLGPIYISYGLYICTVICDARDEVGNTFGLYVGTVTCNTPNNHSINGVDPGFEHSLITNSNFVPRLIRGDAVKHEQTHALAEYSAKHSGHIRAYFFY
ncbi:hypothetical protein VNO77_22871 [Canavalia gladiata]|uniref:Uncharacterized protein n=1 Tax=Canavalia gladiata TaxID=3824 RepID=A0AAN9L3K2_CANGL